MGAVSEEIAGVKKAMDISGRTRLDKSDAWTGKWQGRDIVLVRTGVGRKRAGHAARQAIGKFHPEAIFSIGYAGALIAELKVGDLFIANSILDRENNSVSLEGEDSLNSKWLDLAKRNPPPEEAALITGKLLTVDSVIHSPEAKRDLGKSFFAGAVEMETLEIALCARENKTPFLSVRGISDAVDHELIDSSGFLGSDGEISKLKAGWHVLTHPESLKNALSLRSHALAAARNLTDFISGIISKSTPQI